MLEDYAYHYVPNGIDDGLLTEWWYFNGSDNDTQFLFSYFADYLASSEIDVAMPRGG